MSKELDNISCDLGLGVTLTPRSRSNNVFSCKCIYSLTMGCSNIKLCWYIGHMMLRVLGNILCDLDPHDLRSRSNDVFSW